MTDLHSSALGNGGPVERISPAKRALLAMRDVRAELDSLRGKTDNRIAIIGMGCRFPGASGVNAFWEMLRNRRNGVTEVPADRWDSMRFFNPDTKAPGKIAGRWGGFLEHLDRFDAAFFAISPREAPHVDPRQRKIMEIAWEALEDAGIPPLSLAGSATGVYIATLSSDYDTILCRRYGRISASTGTGTANSIIGNRLSYFLDLHGPSLTLDTACSGSLLTIELACRGLRAGESSLAIAGGVSINLLPKGDVFFSAAGALSPTGACNVFDAGADGIVRSEGVGVVVLKRLKDAVEDGDRIYAVIRGGAINHDGASNGIMAPNGEAQKRVLREAYRNAGVTPGDVQFIEAHGTGTPLGDPIEVSALAGVMSEQRNGRPLMLGSLKSNVGHMEAAAGVGGVIKTALAMHHRAIPPNRQFQEWNPRMPEVPFPVEVMTEMKDWSADGTKRLAGVSAFSFGGTNAHLVLEEAPSVVFSESNASDNRTYVLPISAKSSTAMQSLVESYRDFLESGAEGADFRDVCFTASVRRTHHPFRLAAAASSLEEMSEKIVGNTPNSRKVTKLAFVFSGQGSHWKGMGESYLQTEPVFHAALTQCDALFRERTGWSVIEEISSGERLDQTDISQAAVFSMQVALFELWRSWGIEPDAVVGQSLGEVAAAYAAGALTLETAVSVVHHRSRLMKTLSGQGATAVVGLAPNAVREMIASLDCGLTIAGSSGPETTVVSGASTAVSAMISDLKERKIFAQAISGVDIALHSPHMESLRGDLEMSLSSLEFAKAKTGMMSTVTGSWLNGSKPGAVYWGENLCAPFQFADALGELVREGFDGFLEISPQSLLGGAVRQVLTHENAEALVLGSCHREETGNRTIMASVAALYTAGRNVNWRAIFPKNSPVVSLPAYPWQRERYWFDQLPDGTANESNESIESAGSHPLLGGRIESALPGGHFLWEQKIDPTSPYYLSGHKVLGATVFPGAGYVEAAFAALRELTHATASLEVSGLHFHEAMVLSAESSKSMQVAFSADAAGGYDFQVSARQSSDEEWTNHAIGRTASIENCMDEIAIEDVRERCLDQIDAEEHYKAMASQGLEYASNFRAIRNVRRRKSEALAELELDSAAAGDARKYCVHPILLDAALQVVAATIGHGSDGIYSTESYVPRGFDHVRLYASPGDRVTCVAQLKSGEAGDAELSADIQMIGADGKVCLAIEGLHLAHVGAEQAGAPGKLRDWLYELDWIEKPRDTSAAPVKTGAWTIFSDKGGFGTQLAENMSARGLECTFISSEDDDLEACLAKIDAGIVYLRGLDDPENPCAFPLRLIQGLAGNAKPLWIATRGTQAVADGVSALTSAAELWGFARVVALEHPETKGGIIDLDGFENDVQQVADEILSPDADRQVAFREGKRFVPRLRSLPATVKPSPAVFRSDATYLITGGLGGLGLAMARWMVGRGARRFILTGRTVLPARAEWKTLPIEDAARLRVEAVRELERLGASIHIATFDIADRNELEAYLQIFHAEGWPSVRGVIHAAGVVEDQFMSRLDEESFARVLRPKVDGALALHHATLDLDLDFFTLFSSISSVFGQYGQAHYAAGNAFMDHLAHWRRSRTLPACSINWGPWAEVGIFARLVTTDKTGRTGVFPMLPEQALRAMERVHAMSPAEAIVMSADWSRMPPSSLLSELAPASVSDADLAENEQAAAAMLLNLLLAGPEDRKTQLEEYLTVLAARVLNLDPAKLDPKEPLTAFGMDSIMVVELKHNIEKKLNLSIPIVDLFTGSVVKLAEQLAAKLANNTQLEELLEKVENMSPQELEALLGDTKHI